MSHAIELPSGYSTPDEPVSPFTIRQEVNWRDMDAFAHVNNAVYLSWFENVRFHYFGLIGLRQLQRTEGIGPILARAEVDYRAPVEFPDTLLVNNRTVEIGRTSFVLENAVWSTSQAREVARGRFVIVTVDYRSGATKTPVPDAVRARILELDSPRQR